MSNIWLHRVVIYHDETKDVPARNFKGHVLFFVPTILSVKSETPLFGSTEETYSPQKLLYAKLMECRQQFDCYGKLHFAEISGRTWTKYDFAYHQAVTLAVEALRCRSQEMFDHPLHCKVAAIFYPKGVDWNIYGGNSRKEKQLRHDETLLRILLKGACHYLYNESNPVEVIGIISDGKPAHRQLDIGRVIWRLTYDDLLYGRNPLRDYVSLAPDAFIEHLPSQHDKYQVDTEEYVHANLLQVTDLLLGSIMRASYVGFNPRKLLPRIGEECIKKDIIATPVKEMLDKRKRGAGFIHSSHYRAFTITEVEFNEDRIHFHEVDTAQVQDEESEQLSFLMQT